MCHYTLFKDTGPNRTLWRATDFVKHRLFFKTTVCVPDIYMLQIHIIFRIAPSPPWGSASITSVNTIASRHFLERAVKYQLCDTHSLCGGGVVCQEISPGNYLLFFFAFAARRGLPFQCESENYTATSVGPESHHTSSSGRWALFASFPSTFVPPSINRAIWRHQSHLIWCVVFQSTSAEVLWAPRAAAKKSTASLMDKSQAWNLQTLPSSHSAGPSLVPWCKNTLSDIQGFCSCSLWAGGG